MTSTVVTSVIPHSRTFIGREEIDAVSRVVASRHIAQGREVEELEAEWAQSIGVRGAVAVGTGLAALRLALLALGVRSGHEVIVPAYSCVSILNAVLALGAMPVLADVEFDRWTIDPLSAQRLRSSRTAAIVAVHLFGTPARINALRELGVPVVEDCAHGIGGHVDGRPFGSAGDASIASFYATKMIAGGEGGIVASNDDRLLAQVREARNPSDQAPNGAHLNDKLTDIEASIVRVQLARLSWALDARAVRAARYNDMLASLANDLLVLPGEIEGRIWYRYVVRLLRGSPSRVSERLHSKGVFVDQPVWDLRAVVTWPNGLRATESAYETLLSLPLYPDLTAGEQERVCEALKEGLS